MLTSCSPGWIKFVEQFYPEFIPNLSTCKSPQQMMGAIIKSFFAAARGRSIREDLSAFDHALHGQEVRVRPPEMGREYVPDVDYVLTTRELAELLRMFGIDLPLGT